MIVIFLILALLVLIAALVFALGNPGIIEVTLLLWRVETSLTVVVLVAFGVGALVMAFLLLPSLIKTRIESSSRGKTIKSMEKALPKTED
jgi:uncharacterized integral membrane protein